MILSDSVSEKLKTFLSAIPSWKNLVESQFVKHLGIFLQWAIEDASFKIERAMQENFLDTALNRSSILSIGESIEYTPRKPIPAKGKAAFTNTGDAEFTLARGREFMSEAQLIFTLEEAIVVPPHKTVEATISQRTTTNITRTITESTAFQEILLGKEFSAKVASFKVFVDEGQGETEWEYDRLFTNCYAETLAYDEFYHFTDQIGIRFGNGEFGRLPAAGSKVRIECVETEGDIMLLVKQSLYPIEEIRDVNKQPTSATIIVSETVQGGGSQEQTEEIRRNLHYAPVYNERLLWANDYTYYLKRRYPDIVFVKAWGEEESEKMWGYDLENINKIWICAYSPKRDIHDVAMSAINEILFMCRRFVWYEPEHVTFWLTIEGRILPDCVLSEVKQAIADALENAYGKASQERRDQVLLHEIYELIQGTGYFEKESGAWFDVAIHGQDKAEQIYQMVSIDLEKTVNNLVYIAH